MVELRVHLERRPHQRGGRARADQQGAVPRRDQVAPGQTPHRRRYAWSWVDGSRTIETDNPLFPTDKKAKRLASLLAPFERKEGVRLPFIESLVFCSAAGVDIRLPANIATRAFGRGSTSVDGATKVAGIVEALTDPWVGPRGTDRVVDAALVGLATIPGSRH